MDAQSVPADDGLTIFWTPEYSPALMEFAGAIREAKKGTAELVVLAFLEDEPRHGYELTQLIEAAIGRRIDVQLRVPLRDACYKLEERKWIQGRLGREARTASAPRTTG